MASIEASSRVWTFSGVVLSSEFASSTSHCASCQPGSLETTSNWMSVAKFSPINGRVLPPHKDIAAEFALVMQPEPSSNRTAAGDGERGFARAPFEEAKGVRESVGLFKGDAK